MPNIISILVYVISFSIIAYYIYDEIATYMRVKKRIDETFADTLMSDNDKITNLEWECKNLDNFIATSIIIRHGYTKLKSKTHEYLAALSVQSLKA